MNRLRILAAAPPRVIGGMAALATRLPRSDQFQKIEDVANSLDLAFTF
jgi:hypothetical protein